MGSREFPVDVHDFVELVSGRCRFVDKTPMISYLSRTFGRTVMFCRPEGFGKTLNLSMIDRFYNHKYADVPDVFEGLLVGTDPVASEMRNSFPVIRVDLGHLGDDIERELSEAVAEAFGPFSGLEGLDDGDGAFLEDCLDLRLDISDLEMALRRLCGMLRSVYRRDPIVLVDDFDACFRDIRTEERYREVSSLIGAFMEQTFEYNTNLSLGVIFAEMPSLRTGMFGGFDSYCLCGMQDREGESFLGFSREEVEGLLVETGSSSLDADVLGDLFGGYRVGDVEMYVPSGVITCLSRGVGGGPVREVSADFASALGAVPLYALKDMIEERESSIETVLDRLVSHVDAASPTAGVSQVCSHLSMAGYLRAERTGEQRGGMPLYRFSIPNSRVRLALTPLVERAGLVKGIAESAMDAIYSMDPDELGRLLSEIFALAPSFLPRFEFDNPVECAVRCRDIIRAFLVTPEQVASGVGPVAEYFSCISYGEVSEHPCVLMGVECASCDGTDSHRQMEEALWQTEQISNPYANPVRVGIVLGRGTAMVRFA